MNAPDHAGHTATTTHRGNRAQYLVVGDETTLTEMEAALALLPLCARGRVFIEVPESADEALVPVPARMTVTWLPRSARAGAPGTGSTCAPGEAITRAVRAWAAEMFCDGPDDTQVWLSGNYRGVSELYDHLVDEIGIAAGQVTTPEAFRLSRHPSAQ